MKCVNAKANGNFPYLNSKNEVRICDSKHRCDEQFGLSKGSFGAGVLTMLHPFRDTDRSAVQYHKNVKGSNCHEKVCSKVVRQCINLKIELRKCE